MFSTPAPAPPPRLLRSPSPAYLEGERPVSESSTLVLRIPRSGARRFFMASRHSPLVTRHCFSCTFLRFFAPERSATPSPSIASTLFAQNTQGGRSPFSQTLKLYLRFRMAASRLAKRRRFRPLHPGVYTGMTRRNDSVSSTNHQSRATSHSVTSLESTLMKVYQNKGLYLV